MDNFNFTDVYITAAQNNAAYKLHLKNHLKYATVKNVANYNDCPICQQFGMGDLEGGVYSPPPQQRSPAAAISEENRVFNGIAVYKKSPSTPRRASRAPPIYQRRPSIDSADDQQVDYFHCFLGKIYFSEAAFVF